MRLTYISHFNPSQWYWTADFAEQSLHDISALVSIKSGGIGWSLIVRSRLLKWASIFAMVLLQMGHRYDVVEYWEKHFWWILWPHFMNMTVSGEVNI